MLGWTRSLILPELSSILQRSPPLSNLFMTGVNGLLEVEESDLYGPLLEYCPLIDLPLVSVSDFGWVSESSVLRTMFPSLSFCFYFLMMNFFWASLFDWDYSEFCWGVCWFRRVALTVFSSWDFLWWCLFSAPRKYSFLSGLLTRGWGKFLGAVYFSC